MGNKWETLRQIDLLLSLELLVVRIPNPGVMTHVVAAAATFFALYEMHWEGFFCFCFSPVRRFTCSIFAGLPTTSLVTMATLDQGCSDWQLAPANLNFTLCPSTALLTPTRHWDWRTPVTSLSPVWQYLSANTTRGLTRTVLEVTCWICYLCSYLYGMFWFLFSSSSELNMNNNQRYLIFLKDFLSIWLYLGYLFLYWFL